MRSDRIKIITVVGTRPEIIRLSRVIPLLDEHVDHILVHTGQNFDYELNEIFFKDLQLREPDYFLEVNPSSLGTVIGETIIKSEKVFRQEKPDALLILGDTNSCLAAIMAKRLHIPIYHMEAGNRCFDSNVPEEINRRIIDHVADFNLVYTEHARRHLLSEGLHHRKIYLTGSPMYEVLQHFSDTINNSQILIDLKLTPQEYFVASLHREENVDRQETLRAIIAILNSIVISFGKKVIVSTHPRTRKRLEALENIKISDQVLFLKPFGFFDYIKLQREAVCVISDSGTISEESAILDFPAITLRNAMERPESLDAGTISLTGIDERTILSSILAILKEKPSGRPKIIPSEYQIPDTSWRVLKLILGTAKLVKKWDNIEI